MNRPEERRVETGTIDTGTPVHHDALMRTTIDLPDNLHRIATGLARHTGRSLSQAVAELIERGLELRPADALASAYSVHSGTGLPVARSARIITADDVRSMEDEV